MDRCITKIIKNINDTPHQTLSQILGRQATPKSITMEDEKIIHEYELKQVAAVQAETDKLNDKIHWNRTRCRLLVSKTKAGILGTLSPKTPYAYFLFAVPSQSLQVCLIL